MILRYKRNIPYTADQIFCEVLIYLMNVETATEVSHIPMAMFPSPNITAQKHPRIRRETTRKT